MVFSAFPCVLESLTEACIWRASGGGSPESWKWGRLWRTKIAAPSAPSPKRWKMCSSSSNCATNLNLKLGRIKGTKGKPVVVVAPVSVFLPSWVAPSLWHFWHLSECVLASPGGSPPDSNIHEIRWNDSSILAFYLLTPPYLNITLSLEGAVWLTLQWHAKLWMSLLFYSWNALKTCHQTSYENNAFVGYFWCDCFIKFI